MVDLKLPGPSYIAEQLGGDLGALDEPAGHNISAAAAGKSEHRTFQKSCCAPSNLGSDGRNGPVASRRGADAGYAARAEPRCSMVATVSRRTLAALCLVLGIASPTPAQSWIGNFDQSWNHGFNWDGFNIPNSATAAAALGNATGYAVNIDASVQVQSLTFSNTVPVGYTLTSSLGQTLSGLTNITVSAGVTSTDVINLASAPANGSLLYPIGFSLTITNNAAATSAPTLVIGPNTVIGSPGNGGIVVSGTGFTRISGSYAQSSMAVPFGAMTMNGPGRLELTGDATNRSYGLQVNGGTLAFNSATALGPAGNAITLNLNSATTGGLEFLNGGIIVPQTVILESTSRIVSNGADVNTISGTIGGAGALVKDGLGTLTLTSFGNSFAGATQVNAGVLAVSGLPAGGAVTVGGGELRAVANTVVSGAWSTGNGVPVTFSAATGATLTLGGVFNAYPASTLNFGSAGNSGTVVVAPVGWNYFPGAMTVAVNYGTLQAGNGVLPGFLALYPTTVAAGATLDFNNFDANLNNLSGSGTVLTGTAATTTLTLGISAFSGVIGGAGRVAVNSFSGTVVLSGLNSYSGGTLLSGGTVGVGSDAALGTGAITVTAPTSLFAAGAARQLANAVNISTAQTFTVISDPAGPHPLTLTGPISGGTLVKAGGGVITITGGFNGNVQVTTGTLDFSGAFVKAGFGSLTAGVGATILYDNNATVSGGFLRGPGSHTITSGATLNGSSASANAVVNVAGPASLVNFSNSAALTVTAGSPTLDNFTNQGAGSVTLTGGTTVLASDFQTYGVVTLLPAASGFNQITNAGTSPLSFNGGSRTFLGTPGTAANPTAGIDLHGQNAVVAGGLFVNNGYVVDSVGSGLKTVISDFGSLVKGAGFYQNSVQTVNGGKFQSGNSPGRASFGSFTFGPGGVSDYVFAIDDATGTAGPSPDAAGHVSGWDWSTRSSGRSLPAIRAAISPGPPTPATR
jgi:autotransporter-associated beta strand protein